MATALREETFLPEPTDVAQAARVFDFLKAHERAGRSRPAPRYLLIDSGAGDSVELPPEVCAALRQVVDALRQGLAVTVAPTALTLTTQQAADLLGVSRPTVVKLLEEGRIPYERVSSHRRLALRDLIAYREQRRAEQYAALEASADLGDEPADIEQTLADLRQARRVVAERRRRARQQG